MPFLVRKINKRSMFETLKVENTEEIYADVPTTEFRTRGGTLSTWKIETLDHLDDAVLAIASTSSAIDKMDIIIINTDLLDDNGLEYKQTYAGSEIPIPDLQNTHFDICNITIKKLESCTNVYRTIYLNEPENQEAFIVRITSAEIKEKLKKAASENRIDASKADNKNIKAALEAISVA